MRISLLFQKTEEEWDFVTKIEYNSYKNDKKKLLIEGTKKGKAILTKEIYDLEHPENRLVSIKFWKNSYIDA